MPPPIVKEEVAEKPKITIPKWRWPLGATVAILGTLGVVASKQMRKEEKARREFLKKRISYF